MALFDEVLDPIGERSFPFGSKLKVAGTGATKAADRVTTVAAARGRTPGTRRAAGPFLISSTATCTCAHIKATTRPSG
jgi:hypothetical protein